MKSQEYKDILEEFDLKISEFTKETFDGKKYKKEKKGR